MLPFGGQLDGGLVDRGLDGDALRMESRCLRQRSTRFWAEATSAPSVALIAILKLAEVCRRAPRTLSGLDPVLLLEAIQFGVAWCSFRVHAAPTRG